MKSHACRFCDRELRQIFVDLGKVPLSNAFLSPENLESPESFYPLQARVCDHCFLVQVPQLQKPDAIFREYPYFSSYSEGWLLHARDFASKMVEELGLDRRCRVVEIACNDGYFLKNFLGTGVDILGVEPAENVAKVAEQAGIPVVKEFFGTALAHSLAREGKMADLLVANNVLAHVPDLNDFVAGLKEILKPEGLLTVEFPHLLRLIEGNQFDTIYHEHFSYFSLLTAERVFARHGLKVLDAEKLDTHGGSLRLYLRHSDFPGQERPRVRRLRDEESRGCLGEIHTYGSFAERVVRAKRNILELLIRLKNEGGSIAAYGAPAKGSILLNYCGIREDFLDYAVDRNPVKQDWFIPGTRIPIFSPERVFETRPDYLLILPWNLEEEIRRQMDGIRAWGGRFIIPIPDPRILP